MIATMDFETYSEAGYVWTGEKWVSQTKGKPGLKGVGAPVYSEHHTTEVLCLRYKIPKYNYSGFWTPHMLENPETLFTYIREGGLLEAHNSMFEYLTWQNVCVKKYGWPPLHLKQLRCSQAKAQNWALPGALANGGKVLNLPIQKDKRGTALIKLLCVPKQPTKKDQSLRRTTQTHPELFDELYQYCVSDVDSEITLSGALPDMTNQEVEVFLANQHINARGVAIDTQSLHNSMALIDQVYVKWNKKLSTLTNGHVGTVNETAKIVEWLDTYGVETKSVDKDHVAALLDTISVPPICKEVLKIRQTVSGAATKKLWSIDARNSSDNRIRDLFTYCGAERTGRFAGRGIQVHNLKGSGPDCARCGPCQGISVKAECPTCPRCGHNKGQQGLDTIEWGNDTITAFLDDVNEARYGLYMMEGIWGSLISVMGSSIRGLLVAQDGYDLVSSDYSAIEAVVIAVLAGEQWRIDVFNTHGRIYEASASKLTGVPLEEILDHKRRTGMHHKLRKLGKVAELANGYGGWIGANMNFGAGEFMSEEEIKESVISWREESPAIVEFWGGQWRETAPQSWEFNHEYYGLEGAIVKAMLSPGTWEYVGVIGYTYDTAANVLYCRLPSGRFLSYHSPSIRLGPNRRCKKPEYKIYYKGWNTDPKAGKMGWIEFQLYGGKIAENVGQAVAGDVLKYAIVNAEKHRYPVVIHLHDELVTEVPTGSGSIAELESIMNIMPPWAIGWPIKASGGWRGRRFRK